jgi:hypothetical protein
MSKQTLSKDRIRTFVRSIASNLGRVEPEGRYQIIIYDFVMPFRLDFFKRSAGGSEFRPQDINPEEFDLVVGIFRRIAGRMPEAYHLDNTVITPWDDSGKVVGWHNMDNCEKYWVPGRDAGPDTFEATIEEVLAEKGIT